MSAQPCGCDSEAGHTCDWHSLPKSEVTVYDPARHEYVSAPAPAPAPTSVRVEFDPSPFALVGPTRPSILPDAAKARKEFPLATGLFDYFPDALVAVSRVSYVGNEQHNPGEPLHWARGKSMDQDDTMLRHFAQRGSFDTDGQRHSEKMVWRALAILQLEIEGDNNEKKPQLSDEAALAETREVLMNCSAKGKNMAGYTCTRPSGHTGEHIACGTTQVLERWNA